MNTFYQLLGLLGAFLVLWLIYRSVKGRPELYSRENISKSFSTMGLLGVLLIAFVAFLIFMVRQT